MLQRVGERRRREGVSETRLKPYGQISFSLPGTLASPFQYFNHTGQRDSWASVSTCFYITIKLPCHVTLIVQSHDCYSATLPGLMPRASYRRQNRKIVIREMERTTDLSCRNTYVQHM